MDRVARSAREDSLEERVKFWSGGPRAEGFAAGHAQGYEAGRVEGIEAGRVQAIEAGHAQGYEAGRAEGIEAGLAAGLAEERAHLVRQTGLKFDSDTARHLAELLTRSDDATRLAEVGDWIITCGAAEELLGRLVGRAFPTHKHFVLRSCARFPTPAALRPWGNP